MFWVNRFPLEERGHKWAEAFFLLHRHWRHEWEERERQIDMIVRLRRWEPVAFVALGAGVYALLSCCF